jgi:hypothetical protein
MVKRVARALSDHSAGTFYVKDEMSARAMYLGYARAAIAAMRDPTEAMIRACDWPNTDRNSCLDDVWRCMIDAALTDAETVVAEK